MAEEKDFKGTNHRKNMIDLTRHKGLLLELRPTEIHLKEDGALGGKPSFTIVMTHPHESIDMVVCGQLSFDMWNEGLADIGYEIVKKPEAEFKPEEFEALTKIAVDESRPGSKILWPHDEEMRCSKCKIVTLHSLRPVSDQSLSLPEKLWTCTHCNNQRKK